jgi:hypothetical protein
MATAFPRINEFPSYGLQQDQMRRSGWGGLPSIGSYASAKPLSNQPLRRTPAQMYGGSVATPPPVAPVASRSAYTPLAAPTQPYTQPVPLSTYGNMMAPAVPSTEVAFPMSSFSVPNSYDAYDFQGGSTGAGSSMWDSLGALFKQGKDTYLANKDWLIGDKENAGVIPTGLGIFNAFNQYSAGKERINSMREQNALAREAFNLNKTGMLADYENQTAKRARQEFLTKNPNASPTEIYAAAEPVTKERMKRFG